MEHRRLYLNLKVMEKIFFTLVCCVLITVGAAVCLAAETTAEEKIDPRMLEVNAAARVKDFAKVFVLLKPMAMEGNSDAMYQLSGLYRSGRGVEMDVYTAYEWMKKAADLGHKKAVAGLEVMQKKGWDQRPLPDDKKNRAWYLIEAEQKKNADPKETPVNLRLDGKTPEDAFRWAAGKGQIEKVQIYVKAGVNVNDADANGRTALLEAATFAHAEVVRYLLENKARHDMRDRYGNEPLHAAINTGKTEMAPSATRKTENLPATVQYLLDYGADVNSRDANGNTPLILAAGKGLDDIVQLLLDQNAAVHSKNKKGQTAVKLADLRGLKKTVNILTRYGAQLDKPKKDEDKPPVIHAEDLRTPPAIKKLAVKDVVPTKGWSTLMIASWRGHVKVVEALLNKGVGLDWQDEEGHTALSRAAWQGHKEVVDLLIGEGAAIDIKQKNGMTAISWAAAEGNLGIVNRLIKAGARVNQRHDDGSTPLFLAIEGQHPKTTATLLKARAKCNIKRKDGLTPLLFAAGEKMARIVGMLLSYGADADAVSPTGQSALWYAAEQGSLPMVQNLIANKAKIDQADNDGQTPLFMAAANGHIQVVQELLQNGTKPDAASKLGNTPLMMAASNGHDRIVGLLTAKYEQIDQGNVNGNTALMLAVAQGHIEAARVLLEAGADSGRLNVKRQSAASLAEGNKDLRELIKKYNGKFKLKKILRLSLE